MYNYILGKVEEIDSSSITLDNNGIGYLIYVPNPYSFDINKEYKIFVYQNVREDEISLFGFLTLKEHDLFVKLISVKGLGPRIASSILGRASTENVIKAIEDGDVEFMKRMPGVGNKTASQIILDLKGKLVETGDVEVDDRLKDVQDALKQFGYRSQEIKPVIKALANEKGSTDELVKKALKMFVK